MIDLRKGDKSFKVPTSRGGYMGPDVLVDARNEGHAKKIVEDAGYTVNPHFPTEEIKKDKR